MLIAVLPEAGRAQVVTADAEVGRGAVQAESALGEGRGWLDLGVGGGWTHMEDAVSDPRGSFALDLSGGLWLGSHVGVGVRLGGWTLEGFNVWNPQEGESLSEAFAAVRVRSLGGRPLVASLEGGWLSYVVNDPAAAMREGNGLGWRLSLAWDVRVASAWVVSPSLVGSWGTIHPDTDRQPSFSYWSTGAVLRMGWLW